MEPINIQIELKLSEATLKVIEKVALSLAAVGISRNLYDAGIADEKEHQEAAEFTVQQARELVKTAGNHAGHKAAEKQPEAPQESDDASIREQARQINEQVKAYAEAGAFEEPIQPVGDMPEEVAAISDDELAKKTRETVARLKKAKKSPTIVKTVVFKSFGIEQSSECEPRKRQALIDALDKCAADAEAETSKA